MRRGEVKFQQLQWHLIGTHPQLWRQKCRDEANAIEAEGGERGGEGMPNLVVEGKNGENAGQKGPKEEADEGEEARQREQVEKLKKGNSSTDAREVVKDVAHQQIQLQVTV